MWYKLKLKIFLIFVWIEVIADFLSRRASCWFKIIIWLYNCASSSWQRVIRFCLWQNNGDQRQCDAPAFFFICILLIFGCMISLLLMNYSSTDVISEGDAPLRKMEKIPTLCHIGAVGFFRLFFRFIFRFFLRSANIFANIYGNICAALIFP